MKLFDTRSFLFKLGVSALALQGSLSAYAAGSEDFFELEEIVVEGSRLPEDLGSFAGSVTVLNEFDLAQQTKISNDLGEILGNTVPGMAVSKGNNASNYGQMLRGRKPAVLIDGAPQTIPLRDVARDIRIISPAAIGQIEVIRGSTALYGMGGAGGVINYITKRPGSGDYEFRTDVGFGNSLSNSDSDSFNYSISQAVSGKEGNVDFVLTALVETTGLSYDSEGDLISPDPEIGQGGTSDVETRSYFAKVGYDIDEDQRIEATAGYYRAIQDTDYMLDFGNVEGGYQHATLKSDDSLAAYDAGYIIDSSTANDFAAINYSHDDILGNRVRVSASYQDYSAIFGNNPFFLWGLEPRANNPLGGGQTDLLSEKLGLRVDVETPIDAFNGRILWGVDYLQDTTSQDIYGTNWHYVPAVDQTDISFFAQFEGDVYPGVNVRGGFRQVNFEADIPDYQTVPFYIDGYVVNGEVIGGTTIIGGNDVEGTVLEYDVFLPNFGVLVDLGERWKTFASYSKGFLISDLGRTLRSRYWDSNLDGLENDAQIVSSYEFGFRGNYDSLAIEMAAYRSSSESGTTLSPIEGTGIFRVVRSPERVWGGEISVDWTVNERLGLKASYSRVDGKFDPDLDGNYEQMTSFRIPPEKLVMQADYEISSDWSLFVQGLYSFDHKPFGNEISSPGRNPIDAFFLLDVSVTGQVGRGYLSISGSNILNKNYEPAYSQAVKNDPFAFYKAPGAALSIRYTINY